ncbi:MAG: putative 4-amino-4-deoxy-L-arabinose-phosphoundecaprenol flippase subunit ArnE [Candidatus Erwinia impunctatus]|nr:putative 4-amino-4-deoxy-L-arabinose-phosphoundecaprenol flippase subunit ArnE [Culicoides impunctatus]
MTLLLIVVVSLLSCVGQLCQKQAAVLSAHHSRRWLPVLWIAFSLAALGCAMLIWLLVVQTVPVGIAYPMLSLNFFFVVLAARWIWKENVSSRHWWGVVLIVIGVIVMGVMK